ncbi:tRNA (adenosine(37)-N6)-dimethylallyltransferase MiaA [Mycoplasmatota bacterium WC30]
MDKIIAIVGPTGVGKTRLSIELAKRFNAEIISCDSMQFYKGLDIGTAKIKQAEKQGITHHLLDILDPKDEFSVAIYQKIVRSKIDELRAKSITPILIGGSGLYISSILYDYRFEGEKRRTEIENSYQNVSTEDLANILESKAPDIAAKTDLKNRRRVLRSLENINENKEITSKNLYYKNSLVLGLELERELLYEKINSRVDLMIKSGLIDEAKRLHSRGLETQAIMAIGYKELFQYFDGKNDLETSIDLIKRNSRRYAKRQMTWFKNKMTCNWIQVDFEDFNNTINRALEIVNNS